MNEMIPDSAHKGIARRRLLRGTFAAPAVLTLVSGSALAAASNRRCVANQVVNPELPVASDAADTWIRVRLSTLQENAAPQAIDSTWVKGTDLVALLSTQPPATTSYLLDGSWQCFTAPGAGTSYTEGQIISSPPARPGYTLTENNGAYVAVRVDANGNIIGVVDVGGTDGSAITHSCWTSFKGV